MDMEETGRGFCSLYKNSSEELFLKTLMDNPIGVPTMDMLSFKASFRTDSEELFKKWLTNDDANHGYTSSSKGLQSRLSQSSRMASEPSNLSNQKNMSVFSEGGNMQDEHKANDYSADFNQFSIGESVDEVLQSSNLFLAKAWFLSDQRMTRSRSSELRQRYSEMHNGQEVSNQKGAFAPPSNLSSSNFNKHELDDNTDKVSSYVNMLKNTLEHKRLSGLIEKQGEEDKKNGLFSPQEDYFLQTSFGEGNENWIHQNPIYVEETSKDVEVQQTHEKSIHLIDLDDLANQTNPIYLSSASPSESSAVALIISTGLDGCDGPCISNQTLYESSWKQVGERTILENKVKGFKEQKMDNLKDGPKKRSLERYGSLTSAISEEKENSTKKRRVERSRKMAEAKERNLIPSVHPPDMQAISKRCDDLEKEVRSLKLNLSFMNRKDSEQTKQIEDLQQQNKDLVDENKRLLEEIEMIISQTRKL